MACKDTTSTSRQFTANDVAPPQWLRLLESVGRIKATRRQRHGRAGRTLGPEAEPIPALKTACPGRCPSGRIDWLSPPRLHDATPDWRR